MSFFKIIFVLVFISFESFAQDCKAKIFISSDSDAEYILNDQKIGEGKNITAEKDTGVYLLTVKETNRVWDAVVITDTIQLNTCREYYFNYSFFPRKYIQSQPNDAYVYRNDSLLGNTPLYIEAIPGTLHLKKPGYKDLNTEIGNLHGILNMEETGANNKNISFYKRDLFRYLIGGLLVLGGTTAYFKLKADNKFEQYELTGEDKLLKETRRYDLVSGITFGALQVNFGLLLYFFLSE